MNEATCGKLWGSYGTGWTCSRPKGHDGECSPAGVEPVRVDTRDRKVLAEAVRRCGDAAHAPDCASRRCVRQPFEHLDSVCDERRDSFPHTDESDYPNYHAFVAGPCSCGVDAALARADQ